MPVQKINIGAAPNDKTGDSVRAAFALTNAAIDQVNENTDAIEGKVDKASGMGLSQNSFTNEQRDKLNGLEGTHWRGTFLSVSALQAALPTANAGDYADVDTGAGSDVQRYIWDASDTKWVPQQSATSLTAAQVKTLYESNPDTNAYTNAEKAALTAIQDAPENVIYNAYGELGQAGTSGIVGTAAYSLDGWKHNKSNSATVVWERVELSQTDPLRDSGGSSGLAMYATTPQVSLGAGNYELVGHIIEAHNMQQFIGNPSVLGIWVTVNKSGTYSLALRHPTYTQSYVKTFSLTAGVAQLCAILLPGGLPTPMTWPTSGPGLIISFCLASGSDLITSTTDQWIAGNKVAGTGQTNLIADSSAICLTGLSMCLGSVYRKPRKKTVQQNFVECQRYVRYATVSAAGVVASNGNIGASVTLSPPMYSAPSIHDAGNSLWASANLLGDILSAATSDTLGAYALAAGNTQAQFSRRYLLKAQL